MPDLNKLLEAFAAENRELDAMSPEALRAAISQYLIGGGPNSTFEQKDQAVEDRLALEAKLARLSEIDEAKKG